MNIGVLLLFVLSMLDVASPQPSPSSGNVELREIGRVRASSCPSLVGDANSAITAALSNDILFNDIVKELGTLDLDANELKRADGTRRLSIMAVRLREVATKGAERAQHLRQLAGRVSDPQTKSALIGFANALGGALYRQKKVATDLQSLLARIEYEVARGTTATAPPGDAAQRAINANTRIGATRSVFDNADTGESVSLNTLLAGARDDFRERRSLVDADEGEAAGRVGLAFARCVDPTPALP